MHEAGPRERMLYGDVCIYCRISKPVYRQRFSVLLGVWGCELSAQGQEGTLSG